MSNPDVTVPNGRQNRLKWVMVLHIIELIVLFDQVSKWWVTEKLLRSSGAATDIMTWLFYKGSKDVYTQQLDPAAIQITSWFNLVMVWNTGVSFGLFSGNGAVVTGVLIGVAAMISVGLGIWIARIRHMPTAVAMAMMIGGAIGNIIDRFRYGAVIDFLDWHIGEWHWPAFNVADSAIVLGAILLAWYTLKSETVVSGE